MMTMKVRHYDKEKQQCTLYVTKSCYYLYSDKTTSQAEGGGADNIERDGVGDALKNIFSKSSKKKDHGMEHPSGSKGPPAPYEMKAKPRGIGMISVDNKKHSRKSYN